MIYVSKSFCQNNASDTIGTVKKTFIRDVLANGIHFRIDDSTDNEEIQNELEEMLGMTIRAHVPKRFYVDRSAFDNTY